MKIAQSPFQGSPHAGLRTRAEPKGRWLAPLDAPAQDRQPVRAKPHAYRPLTKDGPHRTASPAREPRLARTARAAAIYVARQSVADRTTAAESGLQVDICA